MQQSCFSCSPKGAVLCVCGWRALAAILTQIYPGACPGRGFRGGCVKSLQGSGCAAIPSFSFWRVGRFIVACGFAGEEGRILDKGTRMEERLVFICPSLLRLLQ